MHGSSRNWKLVHQLPTPNIVKTIFLFQKLPDVGGENGEYLDIDNDTYTKYNICTY